MERKGRRGQTSPGEERSNETGKVFVAHGSVEFCEATPVDLVGESYGTLYGHETDQGLRSVCRCVTCFFFIFFERAEWGALPDFLFCSHFRVQQTTRGSGHHVKK